jgi:FkbM family methyltransferase
MMASKLSRTLSFIVHHPLNEGHKLAALIRFGEWQIRSRLVGRPIVHEWIDNSKFYVRAGETGLTQNIYTGLHEFQEMGFLLHFLRKDDLFIDVGANVGSYTILACAVKEAFGYAFEPVPDTYRRLSDNLKLNQIEARVRYLNIGVGDAPRIIQFTTDSDTTNHVVAPGETVQNTLDVRVLALDEVLADESPTLIKIDVEGYEAAVIKGARQTLAKASLKAVIMELNDSGNRYGWKDDSILETMTGYGFRTYSYLPFERKLMHVNGTRSASGNVIFVRDEDFVRNRLVISPPVKVNANQF